jgi:hypothetical protein
MRALSYRRFALATAASLSLLFNGQSPARGQSPAPIASAAITNDAKGRHLSRETQRELERAWLATAKYNDISKAIADGYADIDVFIPKMGFHYLKSSQLDAEFDPERPELLVYAQDLCLGRMRLVAVEYAVPLNLASSPPEGFTGDADEWHRNETYGLWTLHAWIWFRNPDGVFAEFNPRVP